MDPNTVWYLTPSIIPSILLPKRVFGSMQIIIQIISVFQKFLVLRMVLTSKLRALFSGGLRCGKQVGVVSWTQNRHPWKRAANLLGFTGGYWG